MFLCRSDAEREIHRRWREQQNRKHEHERRRRGEEEAHQRGFSPFGRFKSESDERRYREYEAWFMRRTDRFSGRPPIRPHRAGEAIYLMYIVSECDKFTSNNLNLREKASSTTGKGPCVLFFSDHYHYAQDFVHSLIFRYTPLGLLSFYFFYLMLTISGSVPTGSPDNVDPKIREDLVNIYEARKNSSETSTDSTGPIVTGTKSPEPVQEEAKPNRSPKGRTDVSLEQLEKELDLLNDREMNSPIPK